MSIHIHKDEHLITTIEEWLHFAPPKMRERHWKDGRSAKELAKAFLETDTPQVPRELQDVLCSNHALGSVVLSDGIPEHKIPLDAYPGETRNSDLCCWGQANTGIVAVSIEAKADESFGSTIGKALTTAAPNSNVPKRISDLANAIFGHEDERIFNLRYQLLHASAASLIFAKELTAVAAVFIVFEFHGRSCLPKHIERNRRDFEQFISELSNPLQCCDTGQLMGPFMVPGGEFVPSGIPLYIGRAVRHLV